TARRSRHRNSGRLRNRHQPLRESDLPRRQSGGTGSADAGGPVGGSHRRAAGGRKERTGRSRSGDRRGARDGQPGSCLEQKTQPRAEDTAESRRHSREQKTQRRTEEMQRMKSRETTTMRRNLLGEG